MYASVVRPWSLILSACVAMAMVACGTEQPKPGPIHWSKTSATARYAKIRGFRIVGEEAGGPASAIKSCVAGRLHEFPYVLSAYLVRVDYGAEHNVAIAFRLASGNRSQMAENVSNALSKDVISILKPYDISLDFIPVTKSDIPSGVRPFYSKMN